MKPVPQKTPAQQPNADDSLLDGRRHRSVATRKKIVCALSDLVREGVIAPTAEQVSARAEVGLRTVFRHFDDMETLYREVNTEIDSILQEAMRAQLSGGTWQEKLLHSVVVRAKVFERITPFYLSTQVHRHESPYLRVQLETGASLHRDMLYRLLPRALAKDSTRFEALVLMLSIDAWLRLRREQGLSVAKAIKVMQTAAACLTCS
jgi:AcrR family transcriptional regulator